MENYTTPGPWKADERPFFLYKGDVRIAVCPLSAKGHTDMIAVAYGKDVDEALANAKLIAAAPDLINVLQVLIDSQKGLNLQQWQEAIKLAKEAIEKATK